MGQNRYVDFVSDKDFLECVKWVCDAYPAPEKKLDMASLQRNVIDPFKMVFDIANMRVDINTWVRNERMRQEDKTINNRVGDFHQKLLGKVKGWINLGIGDETKVDLKKNDNSIFMELKNKFNTMNSGATASCRKCLEDAIKSHPKAVAYWGYIVSKDGTSGEDTWVYGGRNDPRIRRVWGNKVYEVVTGDPKALEKVWKALPLAIKDITGSGIGFGEGEKRRLSDFFDIAFRGSSVQSVQDFLT